MKAARPETSHVSILPPKALHLKTLLTSKSGDERKDSISLFGPH